VAVTIALVAHNNSGSCGDNGGSRTYIGAAATVTASDPSSGCGRLLLNAVTLLGNHFQNAFI